MNPVCVLNIVICTGFIEINKAGRNKILLSWNITSNGGKQISKTKKYILKYIIYLMVLSIMEKKIKQDRGKLWEWSGYK